MTTEKTAALHDEAQRLDKTLENSECRKNVKENSKNISLKFILLAFLRFFLHSESKIFGTIKHTCSHLLIDGKREKSH
jgi:hypothetical protein